MSDLCACGRIKVGMTITDARNWNADCPEHGVESDWYLTEGKAHFQETNGRAVALQREAREARRRAKEDERMSLRDEVRSVLDREAFTEAEVRDEVAGILAGHGMLIFDMNAPGFDASCRFTAEIASVTVTAPRDNTEQHWGFIEAQEWDPEYREPVDE